MGFEQLAVEILLLDGAQGGRRGEQGFGTVLGHDPPEGAGIRRADGFALENDRSGTREQRRIDDVGMADDPADIGGGPCHVAGADAKDDFHAPGRATAWPPLSRTTPLGRPVVPEV